MRSLCLAAGAAVLAFASPAMAGDGCCGWGPTAFYPAPPLMVPPTGFVLDPSDARRPVYWVDHGPGFYPAERIIIPGAPTYSEGGHASPVRYPYVRSYYGDVWFSAPDRDGWGRRPVLQRYGHRAPEGRHVVHSAGVEPGGLDGDRELPRVVRGSVAYGYGNYLPPYGAYDYRPVPNARVIHIPQGD